MTDQTLQASLWALQQITVNAANPEAPGITSAVCSAVQEIQAELASRPPNAPPELILDEKELAPAGSSNGKGK